MTIPTTNELVRAALARAAVDGDGCLKSPGGGKLAVNIHPPGDAFPVSLGLLAKAIACGEALDALIRPMAESGHSDDPVIDAVYQEARRATAAWSDSVSDLDASIRRTVGRR